MIYAYYFLKRTDYNTPTNQDNNLKFLISNELNLTQQFGVKNMSKKRTTYSSAFKTKLVLELLQNESTLAEIAAKHNILLQNLVNWKKTFLANAEIAMEPSKAVKEYKEELIKSQEQNERLTALVGKVTVEKEWLAKKLKSLGSSKLKQLIDLKPSLASISINHQCQLLGINRSGLYYKLRVNHAKQTIKSHITKVFEQIPIYGEKKVHKQLLRMFYIRNFKKLSEVLG